MMNVLNDTLQLFAEAIAYLLGMGMIAIIATAIGTAIKAEKEKKARA